MHVDYAPRRQWKTLEFDKPQIQVYVECRYLRVAVRARPPVPGEGPAPPLPRCDIPAVAPVRWNGARCLRYRHSRADCLTLPRSGIRSNHPAGTGKPLLICRVRAGLRGEAARLSATRKGAAAGCLPSESDSQPRRHRERSIHVFTQSARSSSVNCARGALRVHIGRRSEQGRPASCGHSSCLGTGPVQRHGRPGR